MSEYSKDTDRTADVQTHDQTPFSAFVVDHPKLLQGLTDCGYVNASPIQVAALPVVIAGNDTIVEAKNGTGKTLTFVVPALMRLRPELGQLQSVVLAPTREIAVQIQQCFKKVGQHLPKLKCEYFIGGTPFEEDKQKAKDCQIAVGSPGRIKHLLNEHVLNGSEVKIFIIDEVDRLFSDQNFTKDIRLIDAKFPKIKQIVAVSASIDKKNMSVFDEFMQEYSMVKGSEEDMNESEDLSKFLLGIKQYIACVKAVSTNIILLPAKNVRLLNILQNLPYTQCIVFTNYMTRVEAVCNMLRDHNYKADYIRGDQDQNIRLKLVDRLTSFKSKILVATDLIARGIDSSNVDLVINMDCPHDWATYLHRIGRAGRFGNKGHAFTILDDDKELKMFKRIINKIENVQIKMLPIAIEKLILEYADSELENLDLTFEINEIEENGKENTQNDSELKPKEIESNTSCLVRKQDILSKSMCDQDRAEEESLQKLCRVVKETEKKLIDNNMVDKKYLTSDRSFVLFDPEPLLRESVVQYSHQELIEMMSDIMNDKAIGKNETEQNSRVSEKNELKKKFSDQLHPIENEPTYANDLPDECDLNNYNSDTVLNTGQETQNDSGVVNYIPGSWTREEFREKMMNINKTVTNSKICTPMFSNYVSQNPEHKDNCDDTETNEKINKPRFTDVFDLFQIPDSSILRPTNNPISMKAELQADMKRSPALARWLRDMCGYSSDEEEDNTEHLIENYEEESCNEDESSIEEESETELERALKRELFAYLEEKLKMEPEEEPEVKMEQEEDKEDGNECVTDESNSGDNLNITYDKDDQCTNTSAKCVDKSVQTYDHEGFQESSFAPMRREVHQTESNQQLLDYGILDDWYREWNQQLSVIQMYSKKSE